MWFASPYEQCQRQTLPSKCRKPPADTKLSMSNRKKEMLVCTLKRSNACRYSQILPLPILFGSCCQTQSSPNSQLVGWKSRSVTSMRKLHLQWWGRQRAGTLWTRWRSSSAGRRPGSPCTPGQQKYFLSRTFISWHYYNIPPALHWISEVTKWMRRGKILLQLKPFFWNINFGLFWLGFSTQEEILDIYLPFFTLFR